MKEVINITESRINPISEAANAIVFSFDNNYAKYFSAALQSLIENSNPDTIYDIVVYEDGVSSDNKEKLISQIPDNFRLRFFDIKKYMLEKFADIKLNVKQHWSLATYYRLFIPFIMSNYKRVLYLDTDMIINRNIDDLFDIDFEGKKLLVSQDGIAYQKADFCAKQIKQIESYLKLDANSYFNAGMVVYNINNIAFQDYHDRLLDALSYKQLEFQDQDILNIIFYNDVKYLPFYNLQISGMNFVSDFLQTKVKPEYKTLFLAAIKNPKIIHYITHVKPWHVPENTLAYRFWYYAGKTPFYEEIIYKNKDFRNEKKLSFQERLFSVTNGYYHGQKYKLISILGNKIKLQGKYK